MKGPITIDVLAEPALALLPLATIGCLARLLPILHAAGGRLEVNGNVIHTDNLARLIGTTFEDAEAFLIELEEVGLLACDDAGYYCPKMVANESVRRARAAGGRLGGNPALRRRSTGQASPEPGQDSGTGARPTSSSADAVAMIVKAGVAEHIASLMVKAAEQRIGADAFADLVAELMASDPSDPIRWLSEQCDARASRRKVNRSASARQGLE